MQWWLGASWWHGEIWGKTELALHDLRTLSGTRFPQSPSGPPVHVSLRSSAHLQDEAKKRVSVLELGITYHTGKGSCWIFDCSSFLKHGSCWTVMWWWELKFVKDNHCLYWKVICYRMLFCRLKVVILWINTVLHSSSLYYKYMV